MAWIFLAASGELALLSENGSNQLPTSKLTPIVKELSCQEWPIEDWKKLRYGMILELCQDIPLERKKLILSMEDSHARISVLQDLEKAWKESEAHYFSRSCGWPNKLSQSSYFLRTYHTSSTKVVTGYLPQLPRWGMTVAGVLYPLRPLELCINEKDGSCLQKAMYATPTASQASKPIRKPSPTRQNKKHGEDIQESLGRLHPLMIGKKLCPKWISVLMGYLSEWTELEPWAIQWFLSKRKRRLKS